MAQETRITRGKPFTPETARAVARKGGMASGLSRRKKSSLRQYALALRDMPSEACPEYTQGFMAVAAMYRQAQQGNVSAFNALADLLGEKDRAEFSLSVSVPQIIDDIPDESPEDDSPRTHGQPQ